MDKLCNCTIAPKRLITGFVLLQQPVIYVYVKNELESVNYLVNCLILLLVIASKECSP